MKEGNITVFTQTCTSGVSCSHSKKHVVFLPRDERKGVRQQATSTDFTEKVSLLIYVVPCFFACTQYMPVVSFCFLPSEEVGNMQA